MILALYHSLFTFFSTREVNKTSEIRLWIPHISRFLSFRIAATAMHIPGWWLSPHLCWLRWSFRVQIIENTLSMVGAFDSSSWMQLLHWCPSIASTGTFRNGDGGLAFRLHSTEHSLSMVSRSLSNTSSLSPSWANTAFAIVGRCPPASARPNLASSIFSACSYGLEQEGEHTVTWSTKRNDTFLCVYT